MRTEPARAASREAPRRQQAAALRRPPPIDTIYSLHRLTVARGLPHSSGRLLTMVGKRVVLFGVLLSWCALLLALRIYRSGTLSFTFLVWNLVLAAVQAVAALLFVHASERRSTVLIQGIWFILWLAFLPNAPYIVTDF